MAYDEGLAQRARELLEEEPGFVEKKMFGGIGFLLRGNMACGVIKEDLIVRVGSERYEASLKLPYTRKFDITEKPMIGWIMVSSEGYERDEDLFKWIQQGVHYALSLPPK
jgi:TfoX/Sxy family transcriptional regulator of competence genes